MAAERWARRTTTPAYMCLLDRTLAFPGAGCGHSKVKIGSDHACSCSGLVRGLQRGHGTRRSEFSFTERLVETVQL